MAAVGAHRVKTEGTRPDHVVCEGDGVLLCVSPVDAERADPSGIIARRVLVATDALPGWPLEREELHVDRHVMPRDPVWPSDGSARRAGPRDWAHDAARGAAACGRWWRPRRSRPGSAPSTRRSAAGPRGEVRRTCSTCSTTSGRVGRGGERATGRLLTSPASPSRSNAARQT